ncbi:MAG: Dabb family protein [Christensenellales bacterium]|jgi:hypothetical protein
MVKHIVMYKLKDGSQREKERIRDIFYSMRGRIESLDSVEVGLDFLGSERSYDVALVCTFVDEEALAAYKVHRVHENEIKPQIHAARSASVSVDYIL